MKNTLLKFFILFCCLFACSSVSATQITIESISIPNWRSGGTICSMRIYANTDFTDSQGIRYLGGGVGSANYFQLVGGSVSGTVCTIETFNLPSTTDAQVNNQVRYTAALYDEKNTQRGIYLQSFSLPVSLGTNVTWAQISVQNQTAARPPSSMVGYYTAPQVDALIQQNVSASVPDATTLIKGGVKLSVAPASSSNPVALAANDPLVNAQVQTRYADSYANLSSAISAIGTLINTKLVVSSSEVAASDFTTPKNIQLDFEAGGEICPNSGVNVTILSMRDPGSRKVFGCNGNVLVGQNAVQTLNLAWWVGRDDSIDATKPIKNFIDSLWIGSADGFVPMGIWKTSQTINFPLNSSITGQGNRASGFKIMTDGLPVMKIESIDAVIVGDIFIRNLVLDASGVPDATGLLLTGRSPWSASGITIEDVRFRGGEVGLDYYAKDDLWEMQHLAVNRAIFEAPAIGIRMNCLNSDIHLEQPFFYLAQGSIAVYVGSVGQLSIKNYNAFGSAPVVDGVPISDNSTFMYLFGTRNNILLEGGQDENIEYLIRTSTNPYPKGVLNLRNNLVQAKIKASANTTLTSDSNLYVFIATGVFQNDPGVNFVVYSRNDALEGRNNDGTINPVLRPEVFTGNTSRVAFIDDLTSDTTKFGQFTEFRPGLSLATSPQTITPAFTNAIKPAISIISEGSGSPFLQMSDKVGANTFGYQFFRDASGAYQLGWLVADGNQAGFSGFYFNKPLKIQGADVLTSASSISQSTITNLTTDLAAKAPLASPNFTGTPTAATAATGTNTTQLATTAFVQSQLAAIILTGTATLDFPSIAAASQADLTITVTNAAVGDSCSATPNGAPEAGLIWNCFISVTNTATVRSSNITATSIDPAARNFKITLIK